MPGKRVVVIGGGISGLAAAWFLIRQDPGLEVVLLEGSDRVGGKLRSQQMGGMTVDVGAESVLARRPEALDLVHDLGMGAAVVHPNATTAAIWTRGALHPMPRGTLMGVPTDAQTVRGLLTGAETARIEQERAARHEPVTEDLSVGDLVERRVGAAVVDRLVEPLLGGVYAGHARNLSAEATVPALFAAARAGEALTAVAARTAAAAGATSSPVFAGLRGGVGTLPQRLQQSLSERGVRIQHRTTARELHHDGQAWTVTTGPVPRPSTLTADAVVVAVPAAPASRLLRQAAPQGAADLSGIEYASMAVITLAFAGASVARLPGSGFLVPPVDRRTVKAATFSANKWSWVADAGAGPGTVVLRASVGRHREERVLQRGDGELVRVALEELGLALGAPLPEPVDAHVQRWGGGLPQYAVGHRARISRIRDSVARVGGLQVCGAAYDGVGIPACIASARLAAQATLTRLQEPGGHGGE